MEEEGKHRPILSALAHRHPQAQRDLDGQLDAAALEPESGQGICEAVVELGAGRALGGEVSSAKVKHGSLEDAQVHSCLVRTFFRMQFPEVKGGGIVQVSYPLLFTAPGL